MARWSWSGLDVADAFADGFQGQVVDEQGNPVAGALVSARNRDLRRWAIRPWFPRGVRRARRRRRSGYCRWYSWSLKKKLRLAFAYVLLLPRHGVLLTFWPGWPYNA